jgi:hypothetical protein
MASTTLWCTSGAVFEVGPHSTLFNAHRRALGFNLLLSTFDSRVALRLSDVSDKVGHVTGRAHIRSRSQNPSKILDLYSTSSFFLSPTISLPLRAILENISDDAWL